MNARCHNCGKVKPLEEMQLGQPTERCLVCHRKINKGFKRDPYNKNLRVGRVRARRLWNNRCAVCDTALSIHSQRDGWKLTPVTALDYELLRDHKMLEVYALPEEVLTENFTVLCSYDHQRWLANQEEL
jgi:hypothetical protein